MCVCIYLYIYIFFMIQSNQQLNLEGSQGTQPNPKNDGPVVSFHASLLSSKLAFPSFSALGPRRAFKRIAADFEVY